MGTFPRFVDSSRHRNCRSALVGALIVASFVTGDWSVAFAESPLRVGDAAWTRTIETKEPAARLSDGQTADGQLIFWTRIDGSPEALERMRAEGRLPIRHRWWYLVAGRSGVDSGNLENEEPLAVGRSEVFDGLDREVSERGFFDWRTWSAKVQIWPGFWAVQVVDNHDDPLPCKHGIMANQDECLFIIQLEQ